MPVMEIDRAASRTTVAHQRVLEHRAVMGGHAGSGSPADDLAGLRNSRWQPLAGEQLLERLRFTGRPRPLADAQFQARLRAVLEEGLRLEGDDGGVPLVVTKDRLTDVLCCDHHRQRSATPRNPSEALACGALVDVLFRQLVTVGEIDEPMMDAMSALALDDRNDELLAWIEQLSPPDRDALCAEVDRQARGLRLRWPALNPAWLPRTQEPLRSALSHGAVVLSGRADLAIGRPATHEASVALVEVKAGTRRPEHRADLHFYALIEALRHAAPPFLIATYYTRTGELDVEPVTDDLLFSAARRTLIGARSLWNLAQGSSSLPAAGELCPRCPLVPEVDRSRTVDRPPVASSHALAA